jgi:aryl-alcohol dehydrogenase-like predicted oxidoreductase
MQTRMIGELEVSLVGLGCNNFGTRCDGDAAKAIVAGCLDTGVTFFDTADVYGNGASEEMLGEALGRNRDEVVIATKFGLRGIDLGMTGGSPEWIRIAVDRSLRRLRTDWIDLFQLHTPDDDTDIDDTLAALHELVVAGKVREIGCSNFDADRLDNAIDAAERNNFTPFRSVQNRYSVLHREPEAEVFEVCRNRNVGFLPFFPLESGLLARTIGESGPRPGTRLAEWPEERSADFLTEDKRRRAHRLTQFADTNGWTLLELSMSYLACRPEIPSIIAGAMSPLQVALNASSVEWVMSEEVIHEIDDICTT